MSNEDRNNVDQSTLRAAETANTAVQLRNLARRAAELTPTIVTYLHCRKRLSQLAGEFAVVEKTALEGAHLLMERELRIACRPGRTVRNALAEMDDLSLTRSLRSELILGIALARTELSNLRADTVTVLALMLAWLSVVLGALSVYLTL